MTSIYRPLLMFLLAVLATVPIFSQDKVVTLASETKWHRHAVDNAYMNGRISDAAEQYKQYAPIARIAFFDIGYPKDKAEFDQLNGYAILLISALSQSPDELPLKRAYVTVDGKQIELKGLNEISIKNEALTSQVVKTFGQYRSDALFLFPVYLRFQVGELLIDFNRNRNGMKIATFDGSKPEGIRNLPAAKPEAAKSSEKAVQQFIKREYPGYVDQ
jgi:hypothetical protein